MIGGAKLLARRWIGGNRPSAAVKLLHNIASFVESAYSNEGSSLEWNGERRMIEKLGAAGFRIAFDVGANQGDWLMEALAHWPQRRIHAFEVAPLTFQSLMYYFPQYPDLT